LKPHTVCIYTLFLSLSGERRKGADAAAHAKLFAAFISLPASALRKKEWGRFFLLAAANAMHLIM
jgi:hypothetical protein